MTHFWRGVAIGGAWALVTAYPLAAIISAYERQWVLTALRVLGALVGAAILWNERSEG